MLYIPADRVAGEEITPEWFADVLHLLVRNIHEIVGLPTDALLRHVTSPFTGLETAGVPQVTSEDLNHAVTRARLAQKCWAKTPAIQRTKWLLRLHDLLRKNSEALLDIIQWETGKSQYHAFDEIQDMAINYHCYTWTLRRVIDAEWRRGALPTLAQTTVTYSPKGVVGMISPWNYPLAMGVSDALAAIAAGNAVVAKPDSNTPLTVTAAKALMVKAGLHPDLFTIVPSRGSELRTPLINQVDYLMFTGSTRTGRSIAAQCGENLIRLSAELRGKNPMIVLDDADVDAAVKGLTRGAFPNAGQLCVSIERLYVHDSICAEFKQHLMKHIRKMRIATSRDWDADMGVLISPEHLEAIETQVKDALDEGVIPLVRAHRLPQITLTAYAPTILEDVKPGMTLYNQETFDPVVSLYRFHTDTEAISRANDTEYGLNASVWGKSARALVVARYIEAGAVNVNEGFIAAWGSVDAPVGGWKKSGISRRHDIEGICKYMEARAIVVQSHVVPIAPILGLSQEQYARVMKLALQALRRMGIK